MSSRMDLIGQKFFRWTVIAEVPGPLPRRFLCRCDCGEVRTVRMGMLRNGTSRSCGCLRVDRAIETQTYDLSNQRFGRLVAISILEKDRKGSNVWLCRCDCGEETPASTHNLMQGYVQSCGCLKKEIELDNIKRGMEEKTVDGVRVPSLLQKNRTNNTSGHKGVNFDRRSGKWRATIGIKGKFIDLGRYTDIVDAVAARKAGEEKYHQPYIEQLPEWEKKKSSRKKY